MAVSTTVGTAKKKQKKTKQNKTTMQFGIFVFVEVQETNWEVNLQGSKCDGDFIFLWKLLRKCLFPSGPCRLFFKYFYPSLQCDVFKWSSSFNIQYVKIFLLICSVFIIQYRKYSSLVHTQAEIISDANYLVRIFFER